MTKSSLALAREALTVASSALPAYASRFSRKDFTLPQLFAILVLRKFWKTDHRGAVAGLAPVRRGDAAGCDQRELYPCLG